MRKYFPSGTFTERLEELWGKTGPLCVGLDVNIDEKGFPKDLIASCGEDVGQAILRFGQEIVDATSEFVCAFKPNLAFYIRYGMAGLQALQDLNDYIHDKYPHIPVIVDAKIGDIGNTNDGWVQGLFHEFGADAITVHGYLGMEAMKPFLGQKERGIIMLCKTSNPGSGEFQDLRLSESDISLYQKLAMKVAEHWNYNDNCALVAGATYPDEIGIIRTAAGSEMPLLIPGIGKQKGNLEGSIKNGRGKDNLSMILNNSRAILYAAGDDEDSGGSNAKNFAGAAHEAAKKNHEKIQAALNAVA